MKKRNKLTNNNFLSQYMQVIKCLIVQTRFAKRIMKVIKETRTRIYERTGGQS